MEKENVRKFNMTEITAIFFVIISLLIMIPSIIFNVLHNNDKIINYVDSNMFYSDNYLNYSIFIDVQIQKKGF